MKNKEPIMSSAFGLCAFYAIVLTGIDHTLLTSSVNRLPMLFFVFLGVVAGCIVGGIMIFGKQQLLREAIQPSEYMGMKASLGSVPIHAYEPETSQTPFDPKRVRDFPHIQSAEKPELRDFMQHYMDTYRDSHPGHVKMMQKMLDIFEYYSYLPATHVEGGHGGQSLQQHSLLVSHVMAVQKRNYSYKGAKRGKQVLVPLKDPNYVFNANDPLVEMLGLAHDIGKIECFEFAKGDKERRKPIDLRKDHDLTGSRVLARMPEIWELPDADRNLLLTIVAHYHHPSDTPVLPDTSPVVDRMHALLELLIYSDRATGAIEAGDVRSAPEAFAVISKSESYLEDYRAEADTIWEAVLAVVNSPNKFNHRDKNVNVGVKVFSPEHRQYLLFAREDFFMASVAGEMGLTAFTNDQVFRGTRRTHEFTARVLRVLESQDALLLAHDPVERDVRGRLYRVDFYDKKNYFADKEETIPKSKAELDERLRKFSYGSTVIMKCEPNFRGTLTIPEPKIGALILHSRFGSMGIRKQTINTAGETVELENDFDAAEIDIDHEIDNAGDFESKDAQDLFNAVDEAEKPLAQIEAEMVSSRQALTKMIDGTLVAGEPIGPLKNPNLPQVPSALLREFDMGFQQNRERRSDKKQAENKAIQTSQQRSEKLSDLQKKLFAWKNSSRFIIDEETYGPDVVVFLTDPVLLLEEAGNKMALRTWANICESKLTQYGFDVHLSKAENKYYLMVARPGRENLCPNYIEPPAPIAGLDDANEGTNQGKDGRQKAGLNRKENQTKMQSEPSGFEHGNGGGEGGFGGSFSGGFGGAGKQNTPPETDHSSVDFGGGTSAFGSVDASFFDTPDDTQVDNSSSGNAHVTRPTGPQNEDAFIADSGDETGGTGFLSDLGGVDETRPEPVVEHHSGHGGHGDHAPANGVVPTAPVYPLPSKTTASAIAFTSVDEQVDAESQGPALVGGTFFDDPSPEVLANSGPLGQRLYAALEKANQEGVIQLVTLPNVPLLICKESNVKPLMDIEWSNPELTFDKIVSGKLEEDGVVLHINQKNQKGHIALKKR